MEISDRITMTIPQFLTASGLGRSKTYDLIEAREIESALVDRRRVIIVQSYLDYLDRQKRAEANGVGRIASPNPRAAANRKGSGPSPANVGQKSWIASPVANDPAPPRRPGTPSSTWRPAAQTWGTIPGGQVLVVGNHCADWGARLASCQPDR